jgi:diketogulonate reductase-like aldo/keto reductase
MQTLEIRGTSVPLVGLGTWDIRGSSGLRSLHHALEIGYRHIDTAEMYRNEEIVGQAIADSGVDRNQIFLTTKAWSDHLTHGEVKRACERSLERLGLDYIDLYLIHRPGKAPLEETLVAMQELVAEGKTRYIGVSNFSVEQLERSLSISEETIFTDQVEYHPYKSLDALLTLCEREEVVLTAYTPLANGRVMRDQTLQAIGDRYQKSAAQVALRWLVQQSNVITIPKASSPEHQQENQDIFDFELSDEDMRAIDELR